MKVSDLLHAKELKEQGHLAEAMVVIAAIVADLAENPIFQEPELTP